MATKTAKRITRYLNSSAFSPVLAFGAASFLLGSGPAQALDAGALPQDPNVAGGSATFAQSGRTLTVNQSTNRTVIDWRSFNIGSGAQTNFNQPNSGSIAVNRVNASTDPTQIQGTLNANGQVWILNPNGVIFGKTAQINAAGIVASTANIDTGKFMAGDSSLNLTGADHGAVVNDGSISVGRSGLAAFVAPSVRNNGTITAKVGKVALAAGTSFTLDLAGDNLVEIGLGANKAVVDQSGRIINAGGTVTLTARAASQVVDSVINMSGVTSVSSAHRSGGEIVLGADDINTAASSQTSADGGTNGNGGAITAVANNQGNYAGSFSAKGGSASGDGGKIETSGKSVTVAPTAKIDASAANGAAGTWLLDPLNVTITGDLTNNGTTTGPTVTAGTIDASLASGTSVDITTSQSGSDLGDLTLTGSINATSTGNAGLTLEGRHLSETGGSTISISGGALTLDVNMVNPTAAPGGSWINDAIGMIGTVSGGTTINLGNGTYTIASGGTNYVFVNKSNVTIDGQSEDGTIIDASGASTYGMRVWGDDVSLNDFTLLGVKASGGYGFKVEPVEPEALSGRINNFSISNVTEKGSAKNGLDLNGVVTATIDSINISNTTAGTGIAITDSANVTVTNSTTTNNAWGGVALYEHNTASNQQLTNVTIDGTNTFNEVNGIYAEDESASQNFGTIDLTGLDFLYVGKAHAGTNDDYTFFQTSLQNATDLAALKSAAISTATVQGYSGTNLDGNNTFYVGQATGGTALSIQAAVNAASSDATINVAAGTYADTLDITKNVDIEGAGQGLTIIQPTALLDTGVGHKYTADMKATVFVNGASDVTLNNLTIDGNDLGGDAVVFWNNASGTISNSLLENARTFDGVQTGQDLAVDAWTGNTDTLAVTDVTFQNWNKNAIDAETGNGTNANGGNINLTVSGSSFTGAGATNTIAQNGIVLWEQGGGTVNATINDDTFAALDYTGADSAAGVLVYGSPNGTVSVSDSTFTDVQEYISTAGGNSHGIDATDNNTFDGVTASATASLGQLYTIENSILDGTSDGSDGLVRLVANNVYVTATNGSIQGGINGASNGDTVNVQAGTYADTLDITKNVDIEGAGQGLTIIQPTALLDTGVGHKYTADMKATVFVNGASDVTLNNLTIDGNDLGGDAVVFWNNASGTISNSLLENARTFDGVQTGQDLAVDAWTGNTDTLAVTDVTFQNWNKNAIDAETGNGTNANGGNINLTVSGSSFTGAGATNTIAQNGIVLWEQGGGTVNATINDDTFAALDYTGADSAAGVLVYGSPNGTVSVSDSTFTDVQEYISTAGGSPNAVDATTGNTFDGVSPGTATLDQLFAIEDHIVDGTDDTTNGLVRIVPGHVYATAAKYNIQNAVDIATSGDTINVQAGTYSASVDIDKSVNLLGANAGINAADGSGTAPETRNAETVLSHNGLSAFSIDATNVTIDGFEFTGGNGRIIDGDSAANIDGLQIKNNIFNLPSGPQDGGVIQLANGGTSHNIDIANNLFEGNGFAASGDVSSNWVYLGGVTANGFSGLTISGNDFTGRADNAVFEGSATFDGLNISSNYFGHNLVTGLNMGSLDNPNISSNTFVGVQDAGMQIGTVNGGTIEDNTLDGTGSGLNSGGTLFASGIEVWGGQFGTANSSGLLISGNTIENYTDASPLSASDRVTGIYLRPADSGPGGAGPLTISDNTIENNAVGLLANTSVTGSTVTGNTFTDNATQVKDLQGAFDLSALVVANTMDRVVTVTNGNALFGNIQTGVNAAVDGDTVTVGAGTYEEQVSIDKSIDLAGAGVGATTIDAPDVLSHTFTGNGNTYHAVISVEGGADVSISDLTVDGLGKGGANSRFLGIGFQDAGGTVDNVDITGVRSDPLNGAQAGTGLEAFNDDGVSRSITLTNSTIEDFQKNATAFIGGNLTVDIEGDTITGAGSTGLIAQNGVELFGVSGAGNGIVSGTIANNKIQAIGYNQTDNSSSDILLWNAGGNTSVTGNTLVGTGATDSSNGLFVSGTGTVTASANTVSGFGWGVTVDNEAGTGGNLSLQNNVITGNSVAVDLGFDETDNSVVNASNNNLAGNLSGIELESSSDTANFSGNWWGTTDAGAILASMTGADAGLVDFSPFLTSGIDTDTHTAGFQGDFSNLTVTTLGAGSNRIAEAISDATAGGTINVNAGTYLENVTDNQQLAFNFGDVTVNSLTLASGATGSSLSGNLTATGAITTNSAAGLSGDLAAASIALNDTVTLQGSLTLDTSAANGTITTAAIDGAQALTINSGSGAISLGALGAAVSLGAVQVNGPTTLTGGSYDAASLDFNGNVTLATDTTLDATGAVTTGSVDGALALTVNAATASLGNLGATTRLGAVTDNATTTLTGTTYDAASLNFAGATTLTADTTLDATTSVTTGSVDGSHALTINGASASLGNLGATTRLGAVTDNATTTLTGGTYDAASLNFADALTLAADTTLDTSAANGTITTVGIDGAQALTINSGTGAISLGTLGATTSLGAVQVNGPTTLTGGSYDAASLDFGGNVTLATDTTLDTSAANGAVTTAAVDGSSGTEALVVNSGTGAISLGAVGQTVQLGTLDVNGPVTLTGSGYTANRLHLGGPVTLAVSTILSNGATAGQMVIGDVDGASAGAQSLTVSGSGPLELGSLGATTALGAVQINRAATLTGGTYDAASLDFGGALTLTADTVLNTSGAITTAAIDGAQALTIASGNGAISLGALGATTRLGAVQVNGPTTLTAGTYDAASLDFGGNVTLTAATTTLNSTQSATAAGDITFAGSVLGTANGAQSLVLTAGPGTGAASANGDISLQNVGSSTVALNNLTVTGDNFDAQTVDLAGNFTATLVGNQVFSSHTLNAGGTVTSTVGGDASGPVNAGGDVSLNVTGDLTGAIKGTTLDLTAGSITDATLTGTQSITADANTVTGSNFTAPNVDATAGTFDSTVTASDTATISGGTVSGTFSGGTINLTGTTSVDGTVTADTVTVQAPQGTISGDWTNLDTTGSGTLVVNQEANLGNGSAGPNQLVVENFVLPAGTVINANGEIVLPAGLVIGLLSPGGAGGAPKLIYVQSVQSLGALLAEGYTAIVIDLSGHKKNKKHKQQVAMN